MNASPPPESQSLVERLRIGSANLKAPWQKDNYSLCDEAADAIDSLTAEVERLTENNEDITVSSSVFVEELTRLHAEVADLQQFKEWAEPQCEDHVKQKQEIERLRQMHEDALGRVAELHAEIERLRDHCYEFDAAIAECESQEKEIERLRIALGKIANDICCYPAGVAEEALAPEPKAKP